MIIAGETQSGAEGEIDRVSPSTRNLSGKRTVIGQNSGKRLSPKEQFVLFIGTENLSG